MKTVYIVGRLIKEENPYSTWDILGVWDSERDAFADAALRSGDCFVGPIALNCSLPDKAVNWPGAYYPEKVAT